MPAGLSIDQRPVALSTVDLIDLSSSLFSIASRLVASSRRLIDPIVKASWRRASRPGQSCAASALTCARVRSAHSRDGDQVFQVMVITDSSDRNQVRRRTRLTSVCVLEMASWSRLAGWFGDRPGGPWEGPARDAECPHERRSGTRGRGLWAGGAIGREAIMFFSFRRPDGAGSRL
jgi:hypothetical protein